MTTEAGAASALQRTIELLDEPAAELATRRGLNQAGYLDLLEADLESTGPTQDLMMTRLVPAIYERYWRPALGRLVKGVTGPGMAEEIRIARLLLGLGHRRMAFVHGSTTPLGRAERFRGFRDGALGYRARLGLDQSPRMAVVIQPLITGDGLGKTFWMGPKVPADVVNALRQAWSDFINNKELYAPFEEIQTGGTGEGGISFTVQALPGPDAQERFDASVNTFLANLDAYKKLQTEIYTKYWATS